MILGKFVRISHMRYDNHINLIAVSVWSKVAPFVMSRDAHQPFNIKSRVINGTINHEVGSYFNEL